MPSLPQRLKPVRSPGPQIAKKPSKRYSVRHHNARKARTPVPRSPRPWITKTQDHQDSSDKRQAPVHEAGAHSEVNEGIEDFEDSDDDAGAGLPGNTGRSSSKDSRMYGGAARLRILVRALVASMVAVPVLWKFPLACIVASIALLPLFMRPRWVALMAPAVIAACCVADSAFVWGMSGIWLAYIACMLEPRGQSRGPRARLGAWGSPEA